MNTAAMHWVERLGLEPHPEGGHYRRTYTAELMLPSSVLPDHTGDRHVASAIIFLLAAGETSRLHRLASDEMWFYHQGDPLTLHLIHPYGHHEEVVLGCESGQQLQALAPAGVWFGAAPTAGPQGFSLVGNSVAPAFDFADFELANKADLLAHYPELSAIIERLT